MSENVEIRESLPGDTPRIESLYPDAFPDEDLLPLVKSLLPEPSGVLSLVSTVGAQITGHVLFTMCAVDGGRVNVALLAPLAVPPKWQKRGIGTALVRDGLRRLKDTRVGAVLVLGDPRYYSRFGFSPERRIEPPYRLPPAWHDAWQSCYSDGAMSAFSGRLAVPRQWKNPALWAP